MSQLAPGPSSDAERRPGLPSAFLERLRAKGLHRRVVLHTGRRTYVGRLLKVDDASIRLEAESDEFEERCRLEVDPKVVEAFELFSA